MSETENSVGNLCWASVWERQFKPTMTPRKVSYVIYLLILDLVI